jgi:hypothetical protein
VDIVAQPNATAAGTFMFTSLLHPVDTAVVFDLTGPAGAVDYALWVNTSAIPLYAQNGLDDTWRYVGVPNRMLAIQKEVDAAIIGQLANAPFPSVAPILDVTIAAFSDFESSDITAAGPALIMLLLSGAAFILTGVTSGAIVTMTTITTEKARKLVGQLRVNGLLESTYWLSWQCAYLPLQVATALLTIGVGAATGLAVFTHVNAGIHFFAILLLATSSAGMALCLSSVVRQARWVGLLAFCNFGLVVSLTIVFSATSLYMMIYAPVIPAAVTALLALFPFVHFGAYPRPTLRV